MQQKVIYTGSIPQCPYCLKPTKRSGGSGSSTLVYYPPSYDKNGNNTNPDKNTNTLNWQCMECNNTYSVSGNNIDGYCYINVINKIKRAQ